MSVMFRVRAQFVGLLLFAVVSLLMSCQPASREGDLKNTQGATAPLRVVASVGMVGDIVSQVAGDRATVSTLMGEGVDPHLYKPTRDDVAKLLKADAIFHVGLSLEGKMRESFGQLAKSGIPTVAVAETIPADALLAGQKQESGHPDPHVWMDVTLWMQAVDAVAQALVLVDPDAAVEYRARAEAYRSELRNLDAYVNQVVATIPESARTLVTAHDAFGYWGRRYGIEVRAVQGMSTESEAGVADINALVDYLVKKRIPALFVESSVGEKNIRAVVEGAASRGHAVAIGGSLFSDAMGAPGTYEGTYLGMIDHNATTMARALGGSPPERGWKGLLAP